MSWQHKLPSVIVLGVALLVVLAAMAVFGRQHFQPEFLNQGNVIRTQAMANSSYAQQTNAGRPDGRFEAPPTQGVDRHSE